MYNGSRDDNLACDGDAAKRKEILNEKATVAGVTAKEWLERQAIVFAVVPASA